MKGNNEFTKNSNGNFTVLLDPCVYHNQPIPDFKPFNPFIVDCFKTPSL